MANEPTRRWRIAHSESSTGWGGQEHRILAELAGFQKRGSTGWLLAPPESQIYQRCLQAGLPAQLLATGKLQFPFAVCQTARWLRQQQIQVLNPHSSRDAWIVGLAGRWARVPFIVRTRHFDVPIANRWLSGFVYRKLADHLMTTSSKVSAHFQEFFQWPPERVSTVPTGIDVEVFSPTGPKAELVPAAQAQGLPLIGMVSVIRHAKGHTTLMEAARILKDEGFAAHYVIVGEGPSRAPVDERIRALQLGDCVTFLGHREDIPAVLRALSVLVIPSLHEGIPQIGLQALATKTPVIGSNVGGIPEIIRDGETGRIFPALDARALATAIRAALTEATTTRALCERGRERVEKHHSLAGMLDILDALYQRHVPL